MKYLNKIIKTELKEMEIIRETKTCVFVKPSDVKLWKEICISKDSLILVNNGVNLSFELPFKKTWTMSNFKLLAIGFGGNLNKRKNDLVKLYSNK